MAQPLDDAPQRLMISGSQESWKIIDPLLLTLERTDRDLIDEGTRRRFRISEYLDAGDILKELLLPELSQAPAIGVIATHPKYVLRYVYEELAHTPSVLYDAIVGSLPKIRLAGLKDCPMSCLAPKSLFTSDQLDRGTISTEEIGDLASRRNVTMQFRELPSAQRAFLEATSFRRMRRSHPELHLHPEPFQESRVNKEIVRLISEFEDKPNKRIAIVSSSVVENHCDQMSSDVVALLTEDSVKQGFFCVWRADRCANPLPQRVLRALLCDDDSDNIDWQTLADSPAEAMRQAMWLLRRHRALVEDLRNIETLVRHGFVEVNATRQRPLGRPYARMWCSDPSATGETVTKEEFDRQVDTLNEATARFAIFIVDNGEFAGRGGRVGQVYFQNRAVFRRSRKGPGQTGAHITALHYRILLHLLRNASNKDARTLESLVQHCWRQPATAESLRNLWRNAEKSEFQSVAKNYRTSVGRLNDLLTSQLEVDCSTKRTGVYDLEPMPSFCIFQLISQ